MFLTDLQFALDFVFELLVQQCRRRFVLLEHECDMRAEQRAIKVVELAFVLSHQLVHHVLMALRVLLTLSLLRLLLQIDLLGAILFQFRFEFGFARFHSSRAFSVFVSTLRRQVSP